MRKSTTFTLNDRVITINELTMRQIMEFKDLFTGTDLLTGMQALIGLLTDATPEFLLDLTPSELKSLYEKVKEVNADFFTVLPLEELLVGCRTLVIDTVKQSLSALYAASLPQGMAPAPGITG